MAPAGSLLLSTQHSADLQGVIEDRGRPVKPVQRAQVILLSAERLPVLKIAKRVASSQPSSGPSRAGKGIHAILDNYAAHKHPQVLAWLAEHPRWTFHFTPTSCSWLNAVEGFFSKLTRQSLKRGVLRSV